MSMVRSVANAFIFTIIPTLGFLQPLNSVHAIEVFSSGMEVPESISEIPVGFNSNAGDYLVPDPGFDGDGPFRIWNVPAEGGAPVEFVDEDTLFADDLFPSTGNFRNGVKGGMFLPANFGTNGGRYVTAVEHSSFDAGSNIVSTHSRIVTVDGTGNVEDFVRFDYVGTIEGFPGAGFFPGEPISPSIAPQSFGSLAGQLIYANRSGAFAISQEGSVTPFFDKTLQYPFGSEFGFVWGAAFAPDGFGAVGGSLLVNDGRPNIATNTVNDEALILSVDEAGSATVFTSIPLDQQQIDSDAGLRQMGFVPDGFGELTGLLLVSVSADSTGGGATGRLYAIDGSGDIVKTLKVGTEFDKFDPRGFAFTDNGEILISDASDPILLATVDDFIPVPEPSTLALATLGLLGLLVCRRRFRVA